MCCIVFKKSNRVRAKILYCIVFKPKNLPRNFFATKFLCHEIFFATNFFCHEFCRIVLYCIPKNQISRFPYHRVKIKRLYCIVFQKIKFLGFLLIELKLKDCIVLFSKKVFFCHKFCTIVLYCISRFPTYRVKAKRLYCIVLEKKSNFSSLE